MKKNKLDQTLPKDLTDVVEFDNSITNTRSVENKLSENDRAGIERTSANFSSEQNQTQKKEQHVMDETQKQAIAAEVKSLLADKEAAEKVEAKIGTLEGEKVELKDKLVTSEASHVELSKKLDSVELEKAESTDKVVALVAENEKLAEEVKAHKKELDGIKASQMLASRKQELVDLGLLLPEGEKQEKQLEKVKSMSDETFSGYKEELVEIAELSKSASKESDDKAKKKDDEKAEANKEQKDKEEIDKAKAHIEPADVSDGEKYQSAIAALNSEVPLDEDRVGLYAQM